MRVELGQGLSPARSQLANGAVVLVQPTSMAPAVTIDCAFRAGSLYDPADLPGVSQLLGHVLDRGTDRRPAELLAEALDERGVALRVTTTRHRLVISCTCLAEDFEEVLAILVDVARRPLLAETDIDICRAETITALRQDEDNPAVVAIDAFAQSLYGPSHPYGRKAKGRVESVERISRRDLVAFHRRWVQPSSLSLVIVGDVDAERAVALAAAELEDWVGEPTTSPLVPAPPVPHTRRVQHVDMPGKSQADIAYGFNTIRRLDPRYYAYWMMNIVLGQFGLGGRLADNIRERHGMAYYAYSTFDASEGEGPLIVRAGVDPVNVARAVEAIDHEVRTLGTEGPTAAELTETREYLIGSIPRLLETNQSIAEFLATAERYELGLDYDRRLPGLLRAVTMDEVRAAVEEVLDPDVATVATAGPAGAR
jgi:zinc protease